MELKLKIGPAVIKFIADSPPKRWPNTMYGPFEYKGPEPPVLTLRIHRDSVSELGPKRLIAELENSWRLYQAAGFCELEILEQMKLQVRAVARINERWNEIDFYPMPIAHLEDSLKPGWIVGEVVEPLAQWWLTSWAAKGKKGLILHGAAVVWQGVGLAFIGPSEAGKTTMARIFLEEDGAEVLNDERIFLWRDETGWQVSGTPWFGMLGKALPLTAPLARIFFLKKAPRNQILSLSPLASVTRLIPESFLPLWSTEGMEGITALANSLIREVPSSELEFLKDRSIVNYLGEILQDSHLAAAELK